MSRKSLKITVAVATIIAVVILIACIATIAITNRNQNAALKNEKSTKENRSSTVKIQNNSIGSHNTSLGTKDGQTKETGINKVSEFDNLKTFILHNVFKSKMS